MRRSGWKTAAVVATAILCVSIGTGARGAARGRGVRLDGITVSKAGFARTPNPLSQRRLPRRRCARKQGRAWEPALVRL